MQISSLPFKTNMAVSPTRKHSFENMVKAKSALALCRRSRIQPGKERVTRHAVATTLQGAFFAARAAFRDARAADHAESAARRRAARKAARGPVVPRKKPKKAVEQQVGGNEVVGSATT